MKMIINAGIKEVVFIEAYSDELSVMLAKASGIDIRQFTRK
jgi:deoxycytidylate deaminase